MTWIVTPAEPRCADEAVAGGKGASLARLVALGARVPGFVVVSADAYREFSARSLSQPFLAELRTALETISGSGRLAVRSSAIGEDSAGNSFAGLYHTSLQVDGFDAVVDALKDCWSSYSNEAARQYRAERSAERPGGAMAVVIQAMVEAEWAGVTFTSNPVTQVLSEGVVNAIPGIGEALVSGEVNPEEIIVRAPDGAVISRKAGAQGTPLPDHILQEVWRQSKRISDQLAFPQDVEWAWRNDALYILQSRPITTIADVFYSRKLEPWRNDPAADPDKPDRIWSRMMADETWVSPISPLFYDIHNLTPARIGFIRLHDSAAPLPPDIFKYHRATAYMDVDVIQRLYEYQPRLARIRGLLNFLPLEMQAGFKNAPWRWLGRLRRTLRYEIENRNVRSFFKNYRYVQTQWTDYIAKSDAWFDTDLDQLTLEELRAHQADVGREMAIVGPPCGVAVFSHASDLHLLLTGLLDRWCKALGSDGENLYARISAGLEDSETEREADALWGLANELRLLGPEHAACAQTSTWAQFRERLGSLPAGRHFRIHFETFWRNHRHLGSTYKDIVWPRWGDDIEKCFDMVKSYLIGTGEKPSAVNARSAERRRAAQKEVLASLTGPLAPLKREILRFLFRYNALYMSVRDNHRYFVDRNWYAIRRIYRSYGTRLVALGVLQKPDDVFFLGSAEVEEGMNGSLDAQEAARRIDLRRQVWEVTLRTQGPKFLKGWSPYAERTGIQVEDEGKLRGIAASPGSVTGPARVIYDVKDLPAVQSGDILVTRQTDPSWTTVFSRIAGLVLETGGVLSHGTSLCREYGLPCVTSVERATVKISNGAMLELQGSEGIVSILKVP